MSKLSMKSLLRVTVLVVAMLPMGVRMAEASSITVSSLMTAGFNVSHEFGFGTYFFNLLFDHLLTNTTISVTANTVLTETLPAGYRCVPIAGTETSCIQFTVSGSPTLNGPIDPGTNTFDGQYHVLVRWNFNTDPDYPDDPGGRIRLLHWNSANALDDGTVTGSYFAPGNPPSPSQCGEHSLLRRLLSESQYELACGGAEDDDPGVAGTEDGFSTFIVAQAGLGTTSAVPEPGTMALFGSGLAAVLVARRRRQA
jgi:hypothetical protein